MAEETSNVTLEDIRQEQAENSTFNFQAIYKALVLNWYWFILSLIIFLGGAYIYLRYSTPTYQVQTKLLVKDDDSKNGGMSSSLANASLLHLDLSRTRMVLTTRLRFFNRTLWQPKWPAT